ncbi:Late embryogenesis abundant (LEA) hydroxyproline-rich glycoprotein family [Raphanus sativus]|uniref:NDR1/HIN1-like protein 13 n=1 Tax=Raphanus sativus TaxID=3726 RepID=A0A6J0MQ45_RAPSA|nr:NDR1/HIN1-like protein 13 [Raphanus sativus]KAJ4908038.1 Late embryogenesis abundant (LEA) hydroxyproline-rich glycoprotein family [Raphanus sativus]
MADDNTQRWPRNAAVGGIKTDKNIRPSVDSNDSVNQRSPRSSGGFTTDKDIGSHRPKHRSLYSIDSTSSLYSIDSQRSKPPPPGTYHIQLPKEQIYRVPPPENARRYEDLSRQKHNRCRCCCCYFFVTLLILCLLAALVVGIFFLVCRPHKPRFSVSGVSVAGINLTSPSPFSPVIGLKMRCNNVNGKLGLVYERGSAVEIFHEGIRLGDGEFTAFEQPAENVTVTVTKLRGSRIQLTSSSRKDLVESQKKGKVRVDVSVKAPIRFRVGAVTTWTMSVTVDCKVTVDKLASSATVITEDCVTEDIRLI